MLFVGITGGVGAGKSEILNYLKTYYNSKVMLTDEIAHDLMEPGTDCYQKLRELFDAQSLQGRECLQPFFDEEPDFSVYQEDGSFHRPNLAKVIFTDEHLREQMNAIVHPAVKQYVVDVYQAQLECVNGSKASDDTAAKKKALDLLVVESALLIDDNYGAICEEMWYIYTSEENRAIRLKASRGYSDAKIQSIFASQLSEAEFRKHCVEVIDNNQTPQDAFLQLDQILAKKGINKII